jgi:hypothetical protein
MTAHENSRSRPGGAESPFLPCCLVKKWHVADQKMIFTKNQEVYFLALKCKTTPVPAKSAGTCAKFKKYLRRLRNKTRADMCIPECLLFMWGVFPSFRYRISVAASQKKPYFGTLKMEKALFVGRNENRPPWRSSLSQGPRACPIWPRSDKLCHAHGRIQLI